MADQPAASLLASQAAGSTPRPIRRRTRSRPTYTGWQCLTSKTTATRTSRPTTSAPASAGTTRTSTRRPGMPDTVYVIGSNQYGEQPCNTNGVGCGNGRSNGREVLYSTTAGDPDGAATAATCGRSPTCPTTRRTTTRRGARTRRTSTTACHRRRTGSIPTSTRSSINPGNPTQIFEGSDGGLIRTSGAFADISAQCDEPFRNGGGPLPTTRAATCLPAAAVAGADGARPHRQEAEQHAAVHQRRDQPVERLRGHGRHAGQRHLVEHERLRQDTFNAGHLRRRRQRRLRRDEPDLAVQRVHRAAFSDSNFRNGDPEKWVITSAPIVQQRRGRPRSTGRRSATRTRRRARTRSTRREARLAHLGLRRRAHPARSRRTRRRTSPTTRRTARSS